MDLAEATWSEVADTPTSLAVIPVGSTEQHGPHAPLGTDTVTATAVADAGIDAYAEPVIQTPAVPVGASAEHRQFPGTLWLTPTTLRSVVRELIEGLASHGFDRVVVVNGHGGNVDALAEVCATVSRTETAYAVPFTWFDAIDADVGHAGAVETAMLYHLRPDQVRADAVERAAEDAADRWGTWVRGVNLAHDAIEFTENGVVGDPSRADAATGADHLAAAADALATVLAHVADRPWPPDEQRR